MTARVHPITPLPRRPDRPHGRHDPRHRPSRRVAPIAEAWRSRYRDRRQALCLRFDQRQTLRTPAAGGQMTAPAVNHRCCAHNPREAAGSCRRPARYNLARAFRASDAPPAGRPLRRRAQRLRLRWRADAASAAPVCGPREAGVVAEYSAIGFGCRTSGFPSQFAFLRGRVPRPARAPSQGLARRCGVGVFGGLLSA